VLDHHIRMPRLTVLDGRLGVLGRLNHMGLGCCGLLLLAVQLSP
jgi:hypothetical protein